MSADKTGHRLVITADPGDDDSYTFQLACEGDPDDFGRDCTPWIECGCDPTGEQRDELDRDGEAPCPVSPTGLHRLFEEVACMPARGCYLRSSGAGQDATSDAAYDVMHLSGPGTYRITWTGDDDSGVRVTAAAESGEPTVSAGCPESPYTRVVPSAGGGA